MSGPREGRLIETRDVQLADIHVEDRLRPVSDAAVTALIDSVRSLGIIKDPVHLRRVGGKGKSERLVLIAGAHRCAAAKELGLETISAKVWDCNKTWARLLEIDDNLAQAELSPLELATFLAERKAAYLKLYPETSQGRAGAKGRWDNASDIMSFASAVAEKRNISKRHTERLVAIGEALTAPTVSSLQGAQVTLKQLVEISKVDPREQHAIAIQIAQHGAKNAAAARAALSGEPVAPKPAPEDAAYLKLIAAFDRAPMAARRRFLQQLWHEHGPLMAEEADAEKVEVGEAAA